jgi:hypothetical protein
MYQSLQLPSPGRTKKFGRPIEREHGLNTGVLMGTEQDKEPNS